MYVTGTSLPSELTTGNNVSALVDYCMQYAFDGSSDRTLAHGNTVAYGSADSRVRLQLSNNSGNGNLSWSNDTYVNIQGWVDYTK